MLHRTPAHLLSLFFSVVLFTCISTVWCKYMYIETDKLSLHLAISILCFQCVFAIIHITSHLLFQYFIQYLLVISGH